MRDHPPLTEEKGFGKLFYQTTEEKGLIDRLEMGWGGVEVPFY